MDKTATTIPGGASKQASKQSTSCEQQARYHHPRRSFCRGSQRWPIIHHCSSHQTPSTWHGQCLSPKPLVPQPSGYARSIHKYIHIHLVRRFLWWCCWRHVLAFTSYNYSYMNGVLFSTSTPTPSPRFTSFPGAHKKYIRSLSARSKAPPLKWNIGKTKLEGLQTQDTPGFEA